MLEVMLANKIRDYYNATATIVANDNTTTNRTTPPTNPTPSPYQLITLILTTPISPL